MVLSVSIRQADPHAFELTPVASSTLVGTCFNPPSGSSRLRTPPAGLRRLRRRGFNPPSGSSRLRTTCTAHRPTGHNVVSIRQADPHAFEPTNRANGVLCEQVSIRQADPHAFELALRPARRGRSHVSIRQADPHAFEQQPGWRGRPPTAGFNPPSGSSRLRTVALTGWVVGKFEFQSAKRILTPSNATRRARSLP